MRLLQLVVLIHMLLLASCSLAEDVTPPPALATAQAVKPVASPTGVSPLPSTQATVEGQMSEPAEEPATTSQGETALGTIRGRVINGTTSELVTAGIEVHLIGIDGQTFAFNEASATDALGEFFFGNLEIVPDRIFGVYVDYQGVQYFSEGQRFSNDEGLLDLPLIVYEASPDTTTVHVDRLHLIFDFTVGGSVEVMEVWVLSNQGNQTVAPSDGLEGLEFILPSGFRELRFFNEMASERRFLLTDRGFYDRNPLRPIEGTELVFSFTLPYTRRLEFAQPMSYPVSATVILMPENGPEVQANGLQDLGVGDIGGVRQRTYDLGPISAGDALVLRLSGGPLASEGEVRQIGLIIGAVLFGAALIIGGAWWYRIRERDGAQEVAVGEVSSKREELLRAIADLDDSFEAGRVPEDEYRRRRQTLKQQIIELMREAHD
ncbi:MAG TPA: hypothetical protein G4O11_07815 [Anaerolineae bacterium]|nr:hypothetical protein [Anaerolineae bacterium]